MNKAIERLSKAIERLKEEMLSPFELICEKVLMLLNKLLGG